MDFRWKFTETFNMEILPTSPKKVIFNKYSSYEHKNTIFMVHVLTTEAIALENMVLSL